MSHVYRPYPGQDVARSRATLLPAGGGTVSIRGPSPVVAETAWWPESMTQAPRTFSAAFAPPAFVPPRARPQIVNSLDAPIVDLPGQAVAALATPAGAAYVFSGLNPARIPPPPPYPDQEPLIASIAPAATPTGATYVFRGLMATRVPLPVDYPNQEPLIPSIAPIVPPNAVYVYNGLAVMRIPPPPEYPNQEPLIPSIAPIGTPTGAAYVFAGSSVDVQIRTDEFNMRLSPAGAAAFDNTTLIVIPDPTASWQGAYERVPWAGQQPFSTPIAALATPAGASYIFRGLTPTGIPPAPDYPNQDPLIQAVAALTTPVNVTYVFAGLSPPRCSTPIDYPAQDPLLGSIAPFAVVQNLVAPARIAMTAAVDYPNQEPLTEYAAPLNTPAGAVYAPVGLVPTRIPVAADYPGQEPLLNAVAPLIAVPAAPYVAPTVVLRSFAVDYSTPETIATGFAPFLFVQPFIPPSALARAAVSTEIYPVRTPASVAALGIANTFIPAAAVLRIPPVETAGIVAVLQPIAPLAARSIQIWPGNSLLTRPAIPVGMTVKLAPLGLAVFGSGPIAPPLAGITRIIISYDNKRLAVAYDSQRITLQ